MRLSCVLLIALVALLSSFDQVSTKTSDDALTMKALRQGNAVATVTNNKRLLQTELPGSSAILEDNEERASWGLKKLVNLFMFKGASSNFSTAKLTKMLSDPAFKSEMFKTWNAKYSTEKVIAILDLSKKKNIPYGPMLQDFRNTYGRRPIKPQ
ncbi:secreted RxLR effector peptide protein, putative [Phytophthora infestans T30-4]|uniref:RxLR effector protein n=3 Tax=Phytophthora infestans TaxID=4787 RepID=D0NNV3_PHYIT|nr:secreted RxLR effector peptide protein, putative [Phytophthora infestans T30-4]EEY62274.1 secreted RxLR effector peptide protein, putative [Phytophthora infestans T30-4]KAF4032036.1 RXLR domain-containing protein [Phytophthora infestans]KAF4149780.1 RXLR effector domain-containing protein [Phytophthora infestans]|eukprot:XP_002899305.1 secreted RxLR effector peptide protein, putative [Phytophthora infestans T30-4]